jgi:DNA polymerase-3 subunit delta'
MAFDKIKSTQPKVVKLLENSLLKDRLSHAYLFEGENGTKKFETALYFAQMLLCTSEDKPCQVCKNCKRIAHNTHPNVYIIEPEGNVIKKQQIQDLQSEFSKTSLEPGKKIYIIRNIENINIAAANSLLKFLEEPFPNIHAILTTSNINQILSTIISRSQVVTFSSIRKDILKEEIKELGLFGDVLNVVTELVNNTEEALSLYNTEYFLDVVDLVKELFDIISKQNESLVIYFNKNNGIIFQEPKISNLFLDIMILFQKDFIQYLTGNSRLIVFKDELETVKSVSEMKNKNRLITELEYMLELKGKLQSYINVKLAYDNLLLQLERR